MKMKILVVEDDAPQRYILKVGLEGLGFEVHLATDGMEGLKLAEKIGPSVITTDVVMPNMDGLTMINRLRETEWGKQIPVIILTNYDSQLGELSRMVSESPTYYLVKIDSSLEKIVNKIKEITNTASKKVSVE
jgi:CheY-like chemotaxis protein